MELTNPEIFRIHEDNCLEEQEINGLLLEDKQEINEPPNGESGEKNPPNEDNEEETKTPDPSTSNEENTKPLDDMTVVELRTLAKEKGIKGYSDLKKDELIAAIKE